MDEEKSISEKKTLWESIKPPSKWRLPVLIICGIALGIVLNIVKLSNAVSYLSDEPETCNNCHVMIPEYSSWQHSSHRERAKCNDCHVPHDNILAEYLFHAEDGMRHSFVFTFRLEPQVIKIKSAGIEVVQQNCIRCHIRQVGAVTASNVSGRNYEKGEGRLCWQCHRETPHGRVHSQSSTVYSFIPKRK